MANSTEKMTNAKALNYVLNIEGLELPDDVKAKLESIKASIEKKNGAERKPTATQKENINIKATIVGAMEDNKGYTITDLNKSVEALKDLTNQKISALMKQLVDEGVIAKSVEGKRAIFTKVVAE